MSGEVRKPIVDLPEPPPEEYPRVFGNYVLLSSVARGGMGEVFLAKHGSVAGLEKHCVVKTLRPHLMDDREYSARFLDEARIVVQLGHRNICQVHDVGAVGQRHYLAMEYIAGKDLRTLTADLASKGGVVNPGLALHVLCETLEALDYAHRHIDAGTGKPMLLVHRDVSPQNVMISWEGEVKLIDFGLAASALKIEQTSPNVVMGKLAYMSPEQVRGEKVDGRTDLFAAAVVLYELLIGERFYEGKSPYEVWGLAAAGGFRPRGWTALEPDLRQILDRALAATPEARFASCLEFRNALEAHRYAKGLRGDGPLLRALMQHVYGPEIEEGRKQLARLMQLPVLVGPPIELDESAPFTLEPTISFSTQAPVAAGSTTAGRSSSGPLEGTGPTAASTVASPRRRGAIVLAAAALLVGALAVGGVVSLGSSDAGSSSLHTTEPAVLPAPVNESPAGTPTSAPPAAADAGSSTSSPSVPTDVDNQMGSGDMPPPPEASPPDASPPDASPPERNAPERPLRRKPARPLRPPLHDKSTSNVQPAAPPFRNLGWGSRVDALKARCPTLPCTREATTHAGDFGSLSETDRAAFEAWTEGVRRCWTTCGLPGPT